MKLTCQIILKFTNKKIRNIYFLSLLPETNSFISNRSSVEIEKYDDNILKLNISASDLAAIRAVINSYIHWIENLKNLFHLLDKNSNI